jgi:hypothetical protein
MLLHALFPYKNRPRLDSREVIRRLRVEFSYIHADFEAGSDEVRELLPHLVELGVTTQELLEVVDRSQRAVKVTVSDEGWNAMLFLQFFVVPGEEIWVFHSSEELELVGRCKSILGYRCVSRPLATGRHSSVRHCGLDLSAEASNQTLQQTHPGAAYITSLQALLGKVIN